MRKIYILFSLIAIVFIACEKDNGGSDLSRDTGTGGSMARFTICGNYLYSVDDKSLKVFDISTPAQTNLVNTIELEYGVETIFPFNGYLFIGSQTGMYVYSIATPASPSKVSDFEHVYSCDPVVANDTYAFVTLRSGSECHQDNVNRLDILNIENIFEPYLVKSYDMTNPFGLGLDSAYLFVCNGASGLDVYNVSNVDSIVHLKNISGITTYDVIPQNKILLVVGNSGFYQYDYSDIDNITLLSQIAKGQ